MLLLFKHISFMKINSNIIYDLIDVFVNECQFFFDKCVVKTNQISHCERFHCLIANSKLLL